MEISDAIDLFNQYLIVEKGLSKATVSSYMNDLKQRVRALSTELPSRDVGSRGEEIASETFVNLLADKGLVRDVDYEFRVAKRFEPTEGYVL